MQTSTREEEAPKSADLNMHCSWVAILRWKKMAAVHFTTMPYEANTAHKGQGKPYFCNICPCANDIMYAGFEDAKTFLHVLRSIAKVFMR